MLWYWYDDFREQIGILQETGVVNIIAKDVGG